MRVAILTEINDNNYGAILQGFALAHVCRQLGADAEQLDFWYKSNNKALWGTLAKSSKLSGQLLRFLSMAYKLKSVTAAKIFLLRALRSKAFLEYFVPLSATTYKSAPELSAVSTTYDCVIVGSDQVWNPHHFGAGNPFLLQMVQGPIKKLAYAASIGLPAIPEAYLQEYRDALASFQAVSLRERSNVPQVQSLAPCPVTHVLDPSLLLSAAEWRALLHLKAPRTPADVCIYWLGELEPLITLARKLRAEGKTLCVYSEPTFVKKRTADKKRALDVLNAEGIPYALDVGPSEFLNALVHAEAVVSDSFHAMMFSVNFKKPCQIILESSGIRKEMKLRMTDFLQDYASNSPLATIETLLPVKDFPVVQLTEAFDKAKEASLNWLRAQLFTE